MSAEVWKNTKRLFEFDPPIAVEQLVFEVRASAFKAWKAAEHTTWTTGEGDRFPALLRKETWLQDLGEWYRVSIVIYWRTLDDWLGIDQEWLDATEASFAQTVGADNVRLVHTGHDTGAHYFKISEYRDPV